MNAGAQLDLYCERLGPTFWAEPFNALSNVAFLIAAYALVRRSRSSPTDAGIDVLLLCLLALVGAASFAFHTFATVWAHWLDLLFIELFIYSYFALFLRRIGALGWLRVALFLVAYATFEWVMRQAFAPGTWNGSYVYLPALAALVALSVAAVKKAAAPAARMLRRASGIFLIAIILRSVDMAVCAEWPLGTHFIWHVLNAVVLYCCVSALRKNAV